MKSNIRLSDENLLEIEEIVGYSFKDKELLQRCFTLSSASERNNERLEFLGDAVIELCVSEILYLRSSSDEGGMTKIRQSFVANSTLRPIVERLGLEKYLLYTGKRENLGGKPIASLFEALAAGIYLDGGMSAAKQFIIRELLSNGTEKLFDGVQTDGHNYKGLLQEWLQGGGLPRATYLVTGKSGPDHCPMFTVQATAEEKTASGSGGSKTAAEQAAAKKLLELLRNG